jgi:hypothetical protein
VAHAYNPSYSGRRDQEDSNLKPPQANSSQDSIFKKKIHHKKATGRVAQEIDLDFKTQNCKKQINKQENKMKNIYKKKVFW